MKKIIGILVVLLIICLYLIFNEKPEVIVKTETVIETVYDTIDNTKPQQIKKVYIKVPDTIIKNDTITKVIYKDKEVNEYKYIDTLKNGVVKSTILADNIYKRDISLETTDTIINTEVTKTFNKSQLFIGGTMNLSKDLNALNPSIGLYYNRRNKFILGAGVGISNNQANVNVTFAINILK